MTDALADITTKLKELKERDGLDGVSIIDNRVGCNIRLTRGLLDASGTGSNFWMAYSSALKRLNKERNKHEIK